MISLRKILLEVTQFAAKAKDSGKLVYFKTKQAKDNAVKKGTHIEPKSSKIIPGNKKINILNKQKFSSFDKLNKPSKSSGNTKVDFNTNKLNVSLEKLSNSLFQNWQKNKLKHKKKEYQIRKEQRDWSKSFTFSKNRDAMVANYNFEGAVAYYQNENSSKKLPEIDKYLIKNPPPPIKTDDFVYRGISLNKEAYNKLIKDFTNRNQVKFPIQSFSLNLGVALGFAAGDNPNHIIFKCKSDCKKLNGFYLPAGLSTSHAYDPEEEILMTSNQKYTINKIEENQTNDKGNVKFTTIEMTQNCLQKEDVENSEADYTNDEFYKYIFQYKPRKN